MSADSQPVYVPGDVVYGADPFKGAEAARPWLMISNHEGKPVSRRPVYALTLTTKMWMNGLIELDDQDWSHGGMPKDSRIVPWSVQSLDQDDLDYWQGRLETRLVAEAIDALIEYLRL